MMLQSLVKHKSKLEIAKEEALKAAADSAAAAGQSAQPLPGYMRATAASTAMKKARTPTRHNSSVALEHRETTACPPLWSMEYLCLAVAHAFPVVQARLNTFIVACAGRRRAAGRGLQGAPQPPGA